MLVFGLMLLSPIIEANNRVDNSRNRRNRRRPRQSGSRNNGVRPPPPSLLSGIPKDGISTAPSPIGLRLTRVYVGNIPHHMRSEGALIQFFSRYGDIAKVNIGKGPNIKTVTRQQQQEGEEELPRDQQQQQQQQRGNSSSMMTMTSNYGFIQYLNGSSADAAVLDINGRRKAGLERLRVGYAKTKAGVDDIQGDVDAEPLPLLPEDATDECRVFIAGFHNTETVEMLGDYLSQWGLISLLQLVMDKDTGHSKGFGFVQFACPQGPQRLLSEMMNKDIYEQQQRSKSTGDQQQQQQKPIYYQQLIVRGRKLDCKYRVCKEGASTSPSHTGGGRQQLFTLNDEEKLMYKDRAIVRHVSKVEESRNRRSIHTEAPPPPPPPPPPPLPPPQQEDYGSSFSQASLPQYRPPYQDDDVHHPHHTTPWLSSINTTPSATSYSNHPPTSSRGSYCYDDYIGASYTGGLQQQQQQQVALPHHPPPPLQASGYGGSSSPTWDATTTTSITGGYGSYYQPPAPQPSRAITNSSSTLERMRRDDEEKKKKKRRDWQQQQEQEQQQSRKRQQESTSSSSQPSPHSYIPHLHHEHAHEYQHQQQQQVRSVGYDYDYDDRRSRRCVLLRPASNGGNNNNNQALYKGSVMTSWKQQDDNIQQSKRHKRTSSFIPVAGSWYSLDVARSNTINYSDDDDD